MKPYARRLGVSLGALLLALAVGAGDAEAAKRRKKGKGKAKAAAAASTKAPQVNTRAVSELMGPFKWGMSQQQVLGILGKQIEDKYAEKMKATTDMVEHDRIRKRIASEKGALKANLVKFEGKTKTWDVSIIEREFAHNNNESMIWLWENEKDQRRFFFFQNGKLWKIFTAFNSELFQGKSFADFQAAMEARYGRGAEAMTKDVRFLHWKSGGFYLRALDLTTFYGNFCLAISDDKVESTIVAQREARNPKKEQRSSIVQSVIDDPSAPKDPNVVPTDLSRQNEGVIDRLTTGSKK